MPRAKPNIDQSILTPIVKWEAPPKEIVRPQCKGPQCDRRPVARGMCATHYQQERNGNALTAIWPRVDPTTRAIRLVVSVYACELALADRPGAASAIEAWALAKKAH